MERGMLGRKLRYSYHFTVLLILLLRQFLHVLFALGILAISGNVGYISSEKMGISDRNLYSSLVLLRNFTFVFAHRDSKLFMCGRWSCVMRSFDFIY